MEKIDILLIKIGIFAHIFQSKSFMKPDFRVIRTSGFYHS